MTSERNGRPLFGWWTHVEMRRWHGPVRRGRSACDDASPAVPAAAAKLPSSPRVTEMAVSGTRGTGQELSVDDYLVGRVTMFDAHIGLPPAGEFKNLFFLAE
jgi:hypothetical protein